MTHIGLGIDPVTNDLYLDGQDLAFVTGAQAVGQHARQRLMTYKSEWFLNTQVGVPWLDQIMGKGYDPALAEAVVKAEILGTDGVTEITSFSVGFIKDLRCLDIKGIEVLTTYDIEVKV